MCQWRVDLDVFQCETDSDRSGKIEVEIRKIRKIRRIGIARIHAQLVEDHLDVDLCSPSTVMNANESSTQAPALIAITLYICVS